jgi:hypothetical protein
LLIQALPHLLLLAALKFAFVPVSDFVLQEAILHRLMVGAGFDGGEAGFLHLLFTLLIGLFSFLRSKPKLGFAAVGLELAKLS